MVEPVTIGGGVVLAATFYSQAKDACTAVYGQMSAGKMNRAIEQARIFLGDKGQGGRSKERKVIAD